MRQRQGKEKNQKRKCLNALPEVFGMQDPFCNPNKETP